MHAAQVKQGRVVNLREDTVSELNNYIYNKQKNNGNSHTHDTTNIFLFITFTT